MFEGNPVRAGLFSAGGGEIAVAGATGGGGSAP
jgi:hypothetical protein